MPAAQFFFHPEPEQVPAVRRLLSEMVQLMTGDRARAAGVSMAGAELVEHLLPLARCPISLKVEAAPAGQVGFRLDVETLLEPTAAQKLRAAVHESQDMDPTAICTRELMYCLQTTEISIHFRLARIFLEGGLAVRCELLEGGRARLSVQPATWLAWRSLAEPRYGDSRPSPQ